MPNSNKNWEQIQKTLKTRANHNFKKHTENTGEKNNGYSSEISAPNYHCTQIITCLTSTLLPDI